MPTTLVRTLFGVLGEEPPLSPEMLAAALSLVSRTSACVPFRVADGRLEAAFAGTRALGLAGLAVARPLAQGAAKLVDALEGDAAAMGEATVVVQNEGRLVGHFGATVGLTMLLDQARFDCHGKRALVFGAGKGARGVAYSLARAGASEVIIANRTFQRARDLCERLSGLGAEALAAPASAAAIRELLPMAQVVVNATTVGEGAPDESPLPPSAGFHPDALVLELVQRPLKTRFIRQAQEQGAQVVDGLEVLVHEGLATLQLWLGRPVDASRLVPVMRAAALEALLG